jgi:hypothetical protein
VNNFIVDGCGICQGVNSIVVRYLVFSSALLAASVVRYLNSSSAWPAVETKPLLYDRDSSGLGTAIARTKDYE